MEFKKLDGLASGGKGKKKNTKMIVLLVGGVIVLLLVLMRRSQPASSDAPTTEVYADNYDQLGEYFQNNTGMIQAQVDGQIQTALQTMGAQLTAQSASMDATLKQTIASLEAQNTGQLNEYFTDLSGYLAERDQEAYDIISELQKQNDQLYGDLEAARELDKKQDSAIKAAQKAAEAAKKAAEAAKKAPVKKPSNPAPPKATKPVQPKQTAKPSPKPAAKPSPKPAAKTIKTNYKGNSFVDALKSAGVSSGMASRDKIAEKNGIKNYTGTAAQNKLLLNRAKSGHLKV